MQRQGRFDATVRRGRAEQVLRIDKSLERIGFDPAFGDLLGQLLMTEDGGLTWHAIRF